MSNKHVSEEQLARPRVARTIHRFSALIILAWLAIAVIVTISVPPLEQVEREHAISLSPQDAPSVQAMTRMGEVFKESNSGSVAVLVLEGDQPLGDDAHRYYDSIIRQLKDDSTHVQHIQDFWGDPLTAGAAQSADGKAVYVQLNLAGQVGQALGNESVDAVRGVVDRTPPPPGVKAYVTGPAAVVADMGKSGNSTVLLITAVSTAVIFVMLLIVFRSFVTTILLLVMVGIQLQVARGFVAFLGDHGVVGLTTYVVNLLVSVGIAAGTDYGIFFAGRYQEARQSGEDRETAFYTTYRSVAKVVLASGLTIAGAIFCLSFTRLPFFQPLGVPGAVGILVAVAVSLTLMPAVMAAGSRFGLFEPKRAIKTRRWRRVGTAIVRWPAPIFVATLAIALIGLLTLPGYQPSYSDQKFIPKDIPANVGLTAAARHFPQSRMSTPDILLIESDHDMRNPADFLVLNKLAKAIFAVPGISNVQAVTRPEGTPIDHTSIPFMLSMQNTAQRLYSPFQKDRMDDMLKQADEMTTTIGLMQHMYDTMKQMVDTTHRLTQSTHELKEITEELRDHIADFDDFWRPIRNYLYWEPHCFNIPICWSLRSIFDGLDGVDRISDKMDDLVKDLDNLDALLAAAAHPVPADDRGHGEPADHDADHAQHHVGHHGSAGRGRPGHHGEGFRRRQERRFLLPAAGGFQERGLPAGHENLPVTRREGRADADFAKERSRDAGGHVPGRADKDRGRGGAEGNSSRKRQDLPRRHRGGDEGFGGRIQIRSVDRGGRCALPHLHHHADHDASLCRRPGHRGYGGAFAWCVIRAVRPRLAVSSRHTDPLGGVGDVRDRPIGGRV